jgi:hypothetical protein
MRSAEPIVKRTRRILGTTVWSTFVVVVLTLAILAILIWIAVSPPGTLVLPYRVRPTSGAQSICRKVAAFPKSCDGRRNHFRDG